MWNPGRVLENKRKPPGMENYLRVPRQVIRPEAGKCPLRTGTQPLDQNLETTREGRGTEHEKS